MSRPVMPVAQQRTINSPDRGEVVAHDQVGITTKTTATKAEQGPSCKLTTVLATTQTAVGHHQHRTEAGCGADQGPDSRFACFWGSSGLIWPSRTTSDNQRVTAVLNDRNDQA